MSPVQRSLLVAAAVNGFVMTCLSVVVVTLYFYGPDIDAMVAGYIVQIPKADRVWRGYIIKRETGREVEVGCFRLHHLRKMQPAVAPRYVFRIQTQLSDTIPVSAYVSDAQHQNTGTDLPAHDVGETWDRSYCFEMPGTIGDDQWLRVSGEAKHTRVIFGRRFPFWRSVTPVPEFEIAPTFCYQENTLAEDKARCNER